jgi:hypothetical protein
MLYREMIDVYCDIIEIDEIHPQTLWAKCTDFNVKTGGRYTVITKSMYT